MPPGPTSSNSVFAKRGPPICTDTTAPSTSARAARGRSLRVTLPRGDHRPMDDHARLERIFEGHDAPVRAASTSTPCGPTPTRCSRARPASRSAWPASPCARRAVLERIFARDERFRGLMTFTLGETLWLHGHGFRDLLLAYPTADRAALAELGRLEGEGRPIVMVDSAEQLDLIASAARLARPRRSGSASSSTPASTWRGGLVKIGPKRSPIRTPEQAAALAAEIAGARRPRAGGADGLRGPHRRGGRPAARASRCRARRSARMQRSSAREIAERRAAIVAAVKRWRRSSW